MTNFVLLDAFSCTLRRRRWRYHTKMYERKSCTRSCDRCINNKLNACRSFMMSLRRFLSFPSMRVLLQIFYYAPTLPFSRSVGWVGTSASQSMYPRSIRMSPPPATPKVTERKGGTYSTSFLASPEIYIYTPFINVPVLFMWYYYYYYYYTLYVLFCTRVCPFAKKGLDEFTNPCCAPDSTFDAHSIHPLAPSQEVIKNFPAIIIASSLSRQLYCLGQGGG